MSNSSSSDHDDGSSDNAVATSIAAVLCAMSTDSARGNNKVSSRTSFTTSTSAGTSTSPRTNSTTTSNAKNGDSIPHKSILRKSGSRAGRLKDDGASGLRATVGLADMSSSIDSSVSTKSDGYNESSSDFFDSINGGSGSGSGAGSSGCGGASSKKRKTNGEGGGAVKRATLGDEPPKRTKMTHQATSGYSSMTTSATNDGASETESDQALAMAPSSSPKAGSVATKSGSAKKARPAKLSRELRPAPYFYYVDRSRDIDDDILSPLSPPLCVPNFVIKLHAILIRKDLEDVVGWMPHGRSWKITNPGEFEKKVLPDYFKQSNIASFHRQANGWGFRRMLKGPDKGCFYSENFLRGVPHLCKKMKRVGGAKTIEDANISHEPNLWMISAEHPLPDRLPEDDLNYIVLKAINKCVKEGGPKAKMPFVHEIQKVISSKPAASSSSFPAAVPAFPSASNKTSSDSSLDEVNPGNNIMKNPSMFSSQGSRGQIIDNSSGTSGSKYPVNSMESLALFLAQNQGSQQCGVAAASNSNQCGQNLQSFMQSHLFQNGQVGQNQQIQNDQSNRIQAFLNQFQPTQPPQQKQDPKIEQILRKIQGGSNQNDFNQGGVKNNQFFNSGGSQQNQFLIPYLQSNQGDFKSNQFFNPGGTNQNQFLVPHLQSNNSYQQLSRQMAAAPAPQGSQQSNMYELAATANFQQNRANNLEGILKALLSQQVQTSQGQNEDMNLNQKAQTNMQSAGTRSTNNNNNNTLNDNNKQAPQWQNMNSGLQNQVQAIQSLFQSVSQNQGSSGMNGRSQFASVSSQYSNQSHQHSNSTNGASSNNNPYYLKDLVSQAIATGVRIGSGNNTDQQQQPQQQQQQQNQGWQNQQQQNNQGQQNHHQQQNPSSGSSNNNNLNNNGNGNYGQWL